jgi:hypothetical protein
MRKHWKLWLRMFLIGWLAGASTITLVIAQYAVEDFSVPDLIPMFTILAAGGLLLTAAILPLLVWLQRRVLAGTILLPIVSLVFFTLVTGTIAGARSLIFESLPVGEAVSFTGAFAVMGLGAGLAFLGLKVRRGRCRWLAIPAYLILIVLGMTVTAFTIPRVEEALLARVANGKVARGATMSVPRSAHTATLLQDGRVLLAGGMISVRGDEVSTDSVEIYDPTTGTIKSSGKLCLPRSGHTATLLGDGNVLITGGGNDPSNLNSAELYRLSDGQCVPLKPMRTARERHSATMLADGRVLITGGTIVQPSDDSEIFDPSSRTFVEGPRLHARRAAHSATMLEDGRVLIAGGAASLNSVLRSVEIYDPASNAFNEAPPLLVSRYKHSAVHLPGDRVLLLGGSDERDWDGRRNSVEVYDVSKGRSQFVAPLHRARFKFPMAVALTTQGKIVVGGAGRRVEIYDVAIDQFAVSSGSVEDEWFYATATPLADGRVLIAGGYNGSLYPTNQLWIYQPRGAT